MEIIPAIDLKGGRVVRLSEGREDSAQVYDHDPIELAREYEKAGAQRIHVVDLDGAFLGAMSENQQLIKRINDEVNISLEVGGGIRLWDDVVTVLRDNGVRYVILGTMAVERPDLFTQVVAEYDDSIILSIDARGDQVATRGWTKSTEVTAMWMAQWAADLGVQRIIYTDISRDGKLEGPNIEMTRDIARVSGVRVTASGGISSLEDIARLREIEGDGVDSVIVGKALYEGRFTLEEAINTAKAVHAD